MTKNQRLPIYQVGHTRIQPRGGRSTIRFQTSLWKKLSEAGADILPVTVDSNTRLEKYQEAQKLHVQSELEMVDKLNGFPFVAIPRSEILEMFSRFPQPISLRHGSPIAHKLVEKALDCGVDEIEGGPLTYSIPYTRVTPLHSSITSWGKVEQMCASTKSRQGKPILRESFGVLTAVLVPPYVALLTSFLEAIFSYSNGVRHFMIGLQSCGNIYQDQVQFEAARKIGLQISHKYFPELILYYAYHHWMGPFPKDENRANDVIDVCNFSAKLVKADKVVVKTSVEAHGVPSETANYLAVKRTSQVLSHLQEEEVFNSRSFEEDEIHYLVNEVTSAIERIHVRGSAAESLVYAVESGEVDLMFSPHNAVLRKIEVIRDINGWIRVLNFGNMKVTKNFQKFEKRFLRKSEDYLSSAQILASMTWPAKFNETFVIQIRKQLNQLGV